MGVKRIIKSYFSYSRRQLRGIFVMLLLIILVFLFPIVYNLFNKDKVWDHSEYKETIEKILLANQSKEVEPVNAKPVLFSFNPNSVSKEELLKLGFTDKQTATLIKYRNAGGKFYSNDDLKKVYGITDELYKTVKPFILIPEEKQKSDFNKHKDTIYNANKREQKTYNNYNEPIQNISVELNSADSIELIKIPGIGPSFAKRIIAFRLFVGGFYEKEQLLEVFGFTPEMINKIEPYITIDTLLIKKIDLNQADFKTLNKHPYIEYAQTKNLMKYKELMGKFNSADDIIKNHLMDTNSYSKIKPYLLIQ